MNSADKRAARFTLLTQVQKTKVANAAASFRIAQTALEQAEEKLRGLEDYFENGAAITSVDRYAVVLREASVFGSRLSTAITSQRTVCQQLGAQVEMARQFLLEAEKKRVGLEKACDSARREQIKQSEQLDQRRAEDNVMASYARRNL